MSTNYSRQFVSAHARAQIAKALLLTNAGLAAVSLVFHLITLGGWAQPAYDVASLEETINVVELLQGLVGLAQVAVYITTAVAFLMWLHRAYKNLPALGAWADHTPGWVVGHWFIPFLNLVRPYQTVKETWIKSDPGVETSAGYISRGYGEISTTLVGVWWGFWIATSMAGRINNRLSRDAETSSQLNAAATVGAVTDLLTLVAGVFAFLVVGEIDQRQEAKAARLALSAWPAPPPPPASFETPAAQG